MIVSSFDDSILLKKDEEYINAFESAKKVRTNIAEDTVSFFTESEPYVIKENIYGESVYEWNIKFINKLISTINSGMFDDSLSSNEYSIAKYYIEFKYGEIQHQPNDIILSLDAFMGEL